MNSFRSLFPVALLIAATAGVSGCKEDPPAPKPEPASSAAIGGPRGKLNLRNNRLGPIPRIDPQAMKDYRIDVCYFGTLSLRQARDAYLASLGKDEPSEQKIPSFGATATPPARPAVKTLPGGTAKPNNKGAMRPKPNERRAFNFARRAPHERNARTCTIAAGLKEPAAPEIDPALAEFAPYVVELAKNIAAARTYYQREEYKKDSFEKGKELHKKLVAEFEQLDGMIDKLSAAVAGWHKAHPADLSAAEEGEKEALTAYEDARAVMVSLLEKKIDGEALKAAVQKAEESAEALKTYGTGHQADPWSKIMMPSLDAFLHAVKEVESKITDKGIDTEAFMPVVMTFTSVIEAKHRALTKALIAKGQAARPGRSPLQARPGTPPPARPAPE